MLSILLDKAKENPRVRECMEHKLKLFFANIENDDINKFVKQLIFRKTEHHNVKLIEFDSKWMTPNCVYTALVKVNMVRFALLKFSYIHPEVPKIIEYLQDIRNKLLGCDVEYVSNIPVFDQEVLEISSFINLNFLRN